MCGRFAQPHSSEELARIFRARPTVDLPGQQFNVAPTDEVAGVVEHHGERVIEPFRWGLVPWYAEDRKGAARLINARAETVETTPAFRTSFAKRRLIVPAAAFYEWHRSGDRRIPFAVRRLDGDPLALAGVWAIWRDPETGERVYTCSILTTVPNRLVERVHDRMPVILAPDDWDRWLSPETPRPDLSSLLFPFPADELDLHQVSSAVNNVRNNGSELLDRLDPVE
jgi:putative SOS response-associated peptidase YedK